MSKTIYDIAKASGVSIATVSRVFNNSGRVTDKTRKKVLKVAEQLGYHPQAFAQGLASKKKNVIMVVVPVISNYFFMEVLAGIQDKLKNLDYELNIVNIKPEEDLFSQIEYLLKRRWAEGYIFISIHLNDSKWKSLKKFKSPIVIIDDYYFEFDSVSVDNKEGAYKATKYLIDRGFRRIAMISALSASKPVIQRFEGYKRALEEAGIPFDEDYVATGDTSYRDGFTERAGYDAMMKILELKPLPDACFSSSDIKAVGALKALKEKNISLPIISYDNLEISQFLGLSTIRQPMYDMGFLATQNLLDRINKPDKPISHTIYNPEIILRESTEKFHEQNDVPVSLNAK
ncbi:MAG: LacI family DNA-binding transcriptional regulator [Balneolaceae bacterium]